MITLRRVGLVPVENMGECLRENAENLGFVRRKPGLFPDVLYTDMEWLHCCAGNWCAAWADIHVPENMQPGEYPLTVKLL